MDHRQPMNFPDRIAAHHIFNWFTNDPTSLMTTPQAVAAIRLASQEPTVSLENFIIDAFTDTYNKE